MIDQPIDQLYTVGFLYQPFLNELAALQRTIDSNKKNLNTNNCNNSNIFEKYFGDNCDTSLSAII